MRLTRACNYAISALVALGDAEQNSLVPSHVMARKRGIPGRFLLKVLKPLVSAGLLESVKGPNGGYRLARRSNEISLLEVIEAVDGPIMKLANTGSSTTDVKLHRRLETISREASQRLRQYLQSISLATLARK